jgi:hypothetical protein
MTVAILEVAAPRQASFPGSENDYSDEPCLSQEYQIITRINGDYACLLHTVPPIMRFWPLKVRASAKNALLGPGLLT